MIGTSILVVPRVVDTVWERDIIPIGFDAILIDNADEITGWDTGFLENLGE
jgi:hypothetical protein